MNQWRFGPSLTGNGIVFRLWAPGAKKVELLLDRSSALTQAGNGWFSVRVKDAKAGTHYKFRIDGEIDVPDPASSFQPEDVSGPSEVIDHASYQWRATEWRGRPWPEVVALEVHVGTFTPEGTYRAMIGKLDHLVATGITALELMPLADFAGARNWGYDGVLWYAPDSAYGSTDELKALIDEAHLRGLMVLLDVVYNHFGPEGNYLGRYAPDFFTEAQTPWGSAIDYRLSEVRDFAIENALHWLHHYRLDGLRLDAVHAIAEPGEISMLHSLSKAVGKLAEHTGRHLHLVLENDDNIAGMLDPGEEKPNGKFRAQWNDDYHHAWHVLLTGETHGYSGDYRHAPLQAIARALGSGFVYQGEASGYRGGRSRGEPSGDLSPLAFVNFLQNHDQVGNRALGDRLESHAVAEAIEAALAITLLAPMVPMLFMGEEWGSQAPFPFFCDFGGDLANAVRQGRRKEFSEAYARHGDEIPDPLASSTAISAVLDWDARDTEKGRRRLTLVQELLTIRRREIVTRLAGAGFGEAHATMDGLLTAYWRMGDGKRLSLTANLSAGDIGSAPDEGNGTLIWGSALSERMPAWSVRWQIG
jgi:maltooligosyltrehalose trehalohydrolase